MTGATQHDLLERLERLPDLVNNDVVLLRRGRHANADILLEIGATPCHVSVRDGRIAGLQRGPALMRSWAFAIRGSEAAWEKFWQAIPPPRFHDIFALAKFGEFRIEGDFRPLMTHLLYFKGLLAAPRQPDRTART